jgi:hypothetical protein
MPCYTCLVMTARLRFLAGIGLCPFGVCFALGSLSQKSDGDIKPIWEIDKKSNMLSLIGFVLSLIQLVESYNRSTSGMQ